MDILSETTGEAWEKLSIALLSSGERATVENEQVAEIRWLSIHVNKPLKEPRISDKSGGFCKKIMLAEDWKPIAYSLQVAGKTREGYWWNVYGKHIWRQIPKLEELLKRNPSYNKPSIVLRDSVKHLGAHNTPCLVYLTFLIRNGKLESGVHFDTNAVEYVQANMYGLTEVQKIVAGKLRLKVGSYHHYCDSVYTSERHLDHLAEAVRPRKT